MSNYDENLTLARLVHKRAQGENSRSALITFVSYDHNQEEQIETRSYFELWSKACAYAAWFKKQGIQRGDRIAIMLQNHPEFVDALVAASIIGAIVVPIDSRTRGDKLHYQISHAECTGILLADYCLNSWREVKGNISSIQWALVLNSPASDLEQGEHSPADVGSESSWPKEDLPGDIEDCMHLLYTSGTTGDPKAILGLYSKFAMQGRRMVELFGVLPGDRLYTGLSLTHANALVLSLGGCLYSGTPLVISRKFTKSRLWETINRHECTVLNLLGGMFTHILADVSDENSAPNSLRLVISAGMPKAIWKDFEKRFDVRITEFYGSAEGGFTINRDGEGPIGSCGKPTREFELMIIDDDDRPCPAGALGEIAFRRIDGSPIKVDYFRNPEASEKKTKGGWLRMGDIGYVDQEGWLFFMHRKGGGIRRNGEFIGISFLEKEISKYPGIDDVFIYGVDSGNAGEKDIVAALVLNDSNAFDPPSFLKFLSSTLEQSHIPSYLHLVDSIPKTASEKPLERVLEAEFSPEGSNILTCSNYL